MGWNGSGGGSTPVKPKAAAKKPSPIRGLIAGLVTVVVLGVACYFIFGTSTDAPKRMDERSKKGLIKEVAPATTDRVVQVQKEQEEVKRDPWKKDKDGYYHYISAEGKERRTKNRLVIAALTSDKPGVQAPHLIRDEEKNPSRYKSEMQGELLQFLRPGKFFDISRNYKDDEALKMCETPIVYNFDDPDDVLEEKKAMEDLCKDMAQYIRNGGHADDYLGQLAHRQQLEREAIQTTKTEVMKLAREGKLEEARSALAAYNKFLEEKSIPPLSMEKSMQFMYNKGLKERGEQ